MSSAQRILFTGGGSAGHVSVNLALIPRFLAEGWTVAYIGSEQGIERELVGQFEQVRYYPIATGKLRRYFDWQNFKDPFRVIQGVFQARTIIRDFRPGVVFSKGGFVSVPVVIGAWLNRVPAIIHESDLTPGLANRLCIPFATLVCTTFPETAQHLKSGKARHVGAVIRREILAGNRTRGLAFCGFVKEKPVLLIMGGSLGAKRINEAVRANLDRLAEDYQIVHICGKNQRVPELERRGYKQFEFLRQELPDVMAMADVVVSRAGSNSIFEFLALRKPMLLIPLSRAASRGDQILNAQSFASRGFARTLLEEELTDASFLDAVYQTYADREALAARMSERDNDEPMRELLGLIHRQAR